MGGYGRAMSRYAVFQGRASRSEFWWFTGVLMVMALIALIIDGAIAQESKSEAGGIVTAILVLVHLLPSLAVTVRRLHDTNRTGWLIFLNLIPLLGLLLLVFAVLPGTPGPNRFGADPFASPDEATGGLAPNVAGQQPAPPPSPSRRDVIAELERLGSLRREGHLSEAEFEAMKAEALSQGRGN